MSQASLMTQCMFSFESDLDTLEERIKQSAAKAAMTPDVRSEYKKLAFDMTDFCFCATIGTLGAIFNTSDSVKDGFANIHKDASLNSPKTLLGRLMHHKGDPMDCINGKFIPRNADSVGIGFHRLRWGHDIFSTSGDNPFSLMCNKHGLLNGVVKACRHLAGDLFSKNGLPLPGSSFFDFTNEAGVGSNWFEDYSKAISTGSDLNSREAYEALFTINAQDIATYGAIYALHRVYIRVMGIEDKIRSLQILLLSFYFAFFVAAAKNFLLHQVPYINWPILAGMTKTFVQFIFANYSEIKELERITDKLGHKNAQLEKEVFSFGATLPSYETAEGYIEEVRRTEKGFGRMTARFAKRRS